MFVRNSFQRLPQLAGCAARSQRLLVNPCIRNGSKLFSSAATSSTRPRPSSLRRILGCATTLIGGYTILQYLNNSGDVLANSLIRAETPEESLKPCARAADSQEVDASSRTLPFPTHIKVNGFDYLLLGTGTRKVSLLGFEVYVCGIYIRQEDIAKLPSVLGAGTPRTDREDLFKALMDPVNGEQLITDLLHSDIGISIRIVPVRKTDFSHLRDGFVRTLMAQPRFKFENEKGSVGKGITELKRVFSRKMSVPKGNILYLHRRRNGDLIVEYIESHTEEQGTSHVLGAIHVPVASELLFLQYLAGKNPTSNEARKNAITTLARLGVGEEY